MPHGDMEAIAPLGGMGFPDSEPLWPSEVLRRRLLEVRKARRLTQERLAEMMTLFGRPMTKATISEIERGDREVRVDELFLFAAALQKPLIRLVTPSSDDDTEVLVDRLYQSKKLRNWIVYGDSWLPANREAQRGMKIAHAAGAALNPRLDETRRKTASANLLDLLRRH